MGDSVGLPLPHRVTVGLADWLSERVGVPVAVLASVCVGVRVAHAVTVVLWQAERVGEALTETDRVGDRLPVRLAVALRAPVMTVRVMVLVPQWDSVVETVDEVLRDAVSMTVRVMVLIALRDVVRETVGQAVAVPATVMTVRETVLVSQFDRVRETEVVSESVGLEVRLAVITVRVTVLVLQLDKVREPVGEAEKDTSASVLGRDARSAAAVSSGADRDIARACERPSQAGLWQKQRQAMIKRSVVMLQTPARRE